ncbi:hypothetical protein [Hahella ganghwensis]|uniref:hypothetical protein n=1 Tax=Hahella ganghwensis TaxID=286420 RepID=UPI0003696EB3|nr:hypothetical protein [Hahella ganghwensis]
MKILFTCIAILFSQAVLAGNWVEVKGGAAPVEVEPSVLEAALWEYIATHSDQEFQHKDSYTYQYQAVNDHGIRINAMCGSSGHWDLSEGFVGVMDGGTCFFRATYDFKLNAVVWFRVNGVA